MLATQKVVVTIDSNHKLATVSVVIFITSQNPAGREKGFALGADYFIQKPSGLAGYSELATTLANIIRSAAAEPN